MMAMVPYSYIALNKIKMLDDTTWEVHKWLLNVEGQKPYFLSHKTDEMIDVVSPRY